MINVVALVGRIGTNPELRYTGSGMAMTNFRLALSSKRGGEERTDWFDVTAFGKSAEFVCQYLTKGALVGIEGRLQEDTWEAEGGGKRSKVVIIANSVQGLESRAQREERQAAAPAHAEADAQAEPDDPFGWE